MTEAVFADTMAPPDGDAFDAMAPENVAPLVVWLGSAESKGVTGRVFEVEGGILSVADGWQHGPRVDKGARWDPSELGPVVRDLLAQAPAPAPVYGSALGPTRYSPDRMDEVLERYGVATHARLRPDKVAIVAGGRRITYGEVDASATGAAHILRARGVGPDRRLGIALRNRPEWLVAALGAARLGAQVVPIPHGATAEERAYFCEDGEVAFLLDEGGLDPFLADIASTPPEPFPEAHPDYVVLRPYTSGTTGRPKAVLRAVGSADAAILGMVRYYESYGIAGPDEVNLTASPLHHLAGFSGPHSALIVGHTTVLLDHFDAAEAIRAIETERVTYWICAPVHLYRLTRLPGDSRRGRPLERAARDARLGAVRAEREARGDGAVPAGCGVGDLRRHRDDGDGDHAGGVARAAGERRPSCARDRRSRSWTTTASSSPRARPA